MQHKVLKVNASDNVIVALRPLEAGEIIEFEGESYVLPRAIAAKHKFVTEDLNPGDHVTMYGVLVGKATQPIARGEQITTFNLKHESDEYSVSKRKPQTNWQAPDVSKWANRTFMGFPRSYFAKTATFSNSRKPLTKRLATLFQIFTRNRWKIWSNCTKKGIQIP
jgi:altronate hydrolase